jgi:hypothetical protein
MKDRVDNSMGNNQVVYYETIKRELNKRLIYECRCDSRLKVKDEGSTCHTTEGQKCHTKTVRGKKIR